MGKASSAKTAAGRREKIAAQRAAEKKQQARNRLLLAGGAILAVLAVVVAFVLIKSNSSPSPAASAHVSNGPTGAALADLVHTTTTVPDSTLRAIGSGTVASKPISISGAALRSGGKPEMLYMGAEYCPYCAAERWGMVVALSRFGRFSGLATTHSAITNGAGDSEVYPDTKTWTFAHAKYDSRYVTFTPVEMDTNIPDPSTGGYTTLQNPTAEQQALLNHYDAPPYVPASSQGAIPFVNFGNRYLIVGASYDPAVLGGLSWQKIAADLHDPSSPVARAVGGTANYMTAALCRITDDHPGSVCTADIKKLQRQL